MTAKYEIVETELGTSLHRLNEDGSTTVIPKDEANSDYQAYLESLKDAAN